MKGEVQRKVARTAMLCGSETVSGGETTGGGAGGGGAGWTGSGIGTSDGAG